MISSIRSSYLSGDSKDICFLILSSILLKDPLLFPANMTEGRPVAMVTTPHSVSRGGREGKKNKKNSQPRAHRMQIEPTAPCMNGSLCEGKSFGGSAGEEEGGEGRKLDRKRTGAGSGGGGGG